MKSAADEGTNKLYLDDFTMCECEASVQECEPSENGLILTLDQTCFYPGGGGQPCDRGQLTWDNGCMNITKVVKDPDGIVRHIGTIEGELPINGEQVKCIVDRKLRQLHSRLHSAGHLIDLAVQKARYDWRPGRGAHFPDMSFVEYSGDFDASKSEEYRQTVQMHMNEIIAAGGPVTISRVTPDEARRRSDYIPEAILQKYEQVHLATYNDTFDICCGGTHVSNIADIEAVVITKVKKKDNAVRVSYKLT